MSSLDNLIRYINEGELLSKEYEARMSVLMSGINSNLDQNIRKGKKKIMQQNLTQQSIRGQTKGFMNEKSATFLTEEILNLSLERANSKISRNSSQSDHLSADKRSNKNKTKQKQQQTTKKPNETQKKAKKNSTFCVSSRIDIKSSTTTPSSNESFKNQCPNVKKPDIRSRYWTYLFDNLKRAVDEIYQTCENDNSVNECKEVIFILEECVNDFRSLISRIQHVGEYDKIKSDQKPVAWEVRKSSPRKSNNLVNYSSSQLSEANEPFKLDDKINNLKDQSMIGFKDFNPNQNFQNCLNKQFFNDYNDEDSYYEEFDLDNNLKTSSDPIDLLNHETFSDLHSINTDDVSFNTTSPFMAPNLPTIPPSSINHLSVQTQCFNNLLNQQPWVTNLNPIHLSLIQSLNQNQLIGYGNIVSNPSELSPFNTNLANPSQVINNGFLNESFENASLYDDSFRNYTVKSAKQNDLDDEHGADDEDEEGEDADEEEVDDVLRYEFLKKTNLSKRNANQRHNNILKFYEEEEKTIVMEIKQDEKLLSFLNEEAKLTKQLSVDQLMHFNHQYDIIKKSVDNDNMINGNETDDMANSKFSTDLENNDTERNTPLIDYWKKVNQQDDGEYESNRNPSRLVHEKLISVPRKESPNERRRKHEEKQARAQEKREQFYQERLNKLRELTKKIEKVSELKKKLLRTKKATLIAKLQRAEEKRQYLLNLKATKAAAEEQKAHEIAFINNLAAQNRKLSILEKHEKRNEVIKHNIEEERLRKQEEQKAKEQAAELRRKKLENQRMAKIKEIMEKRKQKQTKIEQTQLEKEKERIETARAKVKSREMKLARKEAQFQANKQQVKKRLMQKQEEWGKRHELNLEEIRKKAFEMSIMHFSGEDNSGEAPAPHPYDKPKFCKVCNVTINSEVQLKSHLRGLKHQQVMNESNQGRNLTRSEIEEYNLNCIIDAPKESNDKETLANEERRRQLKKKLKKLKTKLSSKGLEYETNTPDSLAPSEVASFKTLKNSKVPKLVKDMEKNANNIQLLSKHSSEMVRIIQKNSLEAIQFRQVNGPSIIIKLLEQVSLLSAQQPTAEINSKCANNLISILVHVTKNCFNSSIDFVMSNKLMSLVEILNDHSNIMLLDITSFDFGSNSSNKNKISNNWLICSSLFELISSIFSCLNSEMGQTNKLPTSCDSSAVSTDDECRKIDQAVYMQRATDLAALIISYGLIDTLSIFFSNIRGPLDNDQQMAEILNSCLKFLVEITKFSNKRKSNETFSDKKSDDSTGIISTLKATNLVNIVSMLYGMLHKDASTPVKLSQQNNQNMKKLSTNTAGLCLLSLKLLNQIIVLDLTLFQNILGEDSFSLQIRHIASYLIWYFKTFDSEDLLHEVILLIGYFTALNPENQLKIVLGTPPTILQQLCNLSFNYFSDKRLISILFPTLISCCFNNEKNKSVLTNELSADMLVNFVQEKLENREDITVKKKIDDKFEFDKRFPTKFWQEAINYFIQ